MYKYFSVLNEIPCRQYGIPIKIMQNVIQNAEHGLAILINREHPIILLFIMTCGDIHTIHL